MKKVLLLTFFAVLAMGTALAQDENYFESDYARDGQTDVRNNEERPREEFRNKYFNFNFAFQGLYVDLGYASIRMAKSDWGTGFSTGKSFILHKNPVAGMFRFGLDATWCDFNMAKYSELFFFEIENSYQMELSMGIGLSAHFTPIDSKLGIHAYARYNPTLSVFTDLSTGGYYGYTSGVVFGGAVSWGVISLGIEGRWGFHEIDDVEDEFKFLTKGGRVYLGFRF